MEIGSLIGKMKEAGVDAGSFMKTIMDTPPKRMMRAKDAAKYLQIGQSTLWLWTRNRSGFPQPIKIGPRTTVFDMGEIEAYIRTHGAIYGTGKQDVLSMAIEAGFKRFDSKSEESIFMGDAATLSRFAIAIVSEFLTLESGQAK